MLCGATVPVAVAALTGGEEELAGFSLEVGRPLRPMLASSAPDLPAAVEKVGPGVELAVDCKLDGIRMQVHKHDGGVRVYTRTLDDITDRLPEVVEAVAALPARTLVLDGEAIALDAGGRPRPFQETAARTASKLDVATLRTRVPLTSYFFDLLHVDGEDLLDRARPATGSTALADGAPGRPRGAAPGHRRRAGGRGLLRRARSPPATRAWSSRGSTRRTTPAGAVGLVGEGQAAAHARPRGAGRRVGQRPAQRAGCPTSISAPATRTAAS